MKFLVKTLSEFIGFPNEVFAEKSNEKKVTDSEDRVSAAGDLSPRRKTPRSSPGGQAWHEDHLFLVEDQSAFFVNDA